MIHDPLAAFEALRAVERRMAMATLVSATGAAARMIGAKTFVGETGRIIGSVTIGGCVDSRAAAASDDVLASGVPVLLPLSLAEEDAWDLGLSCAETLHVLVESIQCTHDDDPIVAAYAAVRHALAAGHRAVVVRALEGSGRRLVVFDRHDTMGSLGDPAIDARWSAIARGYTKDLASVMHDEESGRDYFVEPYAPPATVIIYGAGEVAAALTRIVHEIGLRVVVVDARARYATRDRFPEADEIHVGAPDAMTVALPATHETCIVLVAHDYKYELPVLRHALRAPVGYIGMLASRKRGAAVREYLADEGFTPDELARIHSPIGLDIGARTPAEIALAIAAELLAVRRGRNIGS